MMKTRMMRRSESYCCSRRMRSGSTTKMRMKKKSCLTMSANSMMTMTSGSCSTTKTRSRRMRRKNVKRTRRTKSARRSSMNYEEVQMDEDWVGELHTARDTATVR